MTTLKHYFCRVFSLLFSFQCFSLLLFVLSKIKQIKQKCNFFFVNLILLGTNWHYLCFATYSKTRPTYGKRGERIGPVFNTTPAPVFHSWVLTPVLDTKTPNSWTRFQHYYTIVYIYIFVCVYVCVVEFLSGPSLASLRVTIWAKPVFIYVCPKALETKNTRNIGASAHLLKTEKMNNKM